MDYKKMLGEAYRDDMTAEEIVKALEAVDDPQDNSAEIAKLKKSVSDANSEAAKYKKELKDKMSEEEKKQAADAEREAHYAELERKINVSEHKAKFLEVGFDADTAQETAEALCDGKLDVLFSNLDTFKATLEKKFKADLVNKTPVKPDGGNPTTTVTKEQFAKMGYTERVKLQSEHPELYNELTK
jgi:hypothetical protein